MTIFKKDLRTWLTLILTLLISTTILDVLVVFTERSKVAEAADDPRYVKIISEIRNQNLDADKIQNALSLEEPRYQEFFEGLIGFIFFFVFFDLIFRCVARVILGAWKGPWIS